VAHSTLLDFWTGRLRNEPIDRLNFEPRLETSRKKRYSNNSDRHALPKLCNPFDRYGLSAVLLPSLRFEGEDPDGIAIVAPSVPQDASTGARMGKRPGWDRERLTGHLRPSLCEKWMDG
jgi:hypothetical protein